MPNIIDGSIERKTLGNILGNDHAKLVCEYGGVWSYLITAPRSLDDEAEIRIHVVYGIKGQPAQTTRLYVIHLEPKV